MKCTNLHSNLVDLVCENAVMPLNRENATLMRILVVKCANLHNNPVDLVCENAVMPLNREKCHSHEDLGCEVRQLA